MKAGLIGKYDIILTGNYSFSPFGIVFIRNMFYIVEVKSSIFR